MVESKTYIATPPGATIKELLEDRSMKQKEFACRMGFSEKHISKLINGDVHLTPDVAEKLELVLNVPAKFWNNLEAIYQEKLAKVRLENDLEKQKGLAKKYPYAAMVARGLVPQTKTCEEKVKNLCKYFEVNNLEILEGDNGKRLLPMACRKLGDTEKSTYILKVLAQYARKQSRMMCIKPFHAKTLKAAIPSLRCLTKCQELDFLEDLVSILKNCGIALVFLPAFEGSYLQGVSFYDAATKKIIIGMTTRGKDADIFWFSLFHEISHVLQHHIHLENETTPQDEAIADAMAADILIPRECLNDFYGKNDYSIEAIKTFAESIDTGSSIIIGRLQHDHKLRYDQLNEHKAKYDYKILKG